jgi:hypothetical protein
MNEGLIISDFGLQMYSTGNILCEVRTPQFKNGIVDLFLYQTGYINTETWSFDGHKHKINFQTEEKFKQHLVKWL